MDLAFIYSGEEEWMKSADHQREHQEEAQIIRENTRKTDIVAMYLCIKF